MMLKVDDKRFLLVLVLIAKGWSPERALSLSQEIIEKL